MNLLKRIKAIVYHIIIVESSVLGEEAGDSIRNIFGRSLRRRVSEHSEPVVTNSNRNSFQNSSSHIQSIIISYIERLIEMEGTGIRTEQSSSQST